MIESRNIVHAFWKRQAQRVEEFLDSSTSAHHFIDRFSAAVGEEPGSFPRFVRAAQERFEPSLIATRHGRLSRGEIPPITHRIWLTSPTEPSLPPAEYLDNIMRANAALAPDIVHYFWTNSAAAARAVSEKAVAARCFNVIIVGIDFFAGSPTLARVAKLIAARKFVVAGDMMKFLVVERFGGVYADLGIVFNDRIFELIRLSEYAFLVGDSPFFQTSFFGCAPASDLARLFLGVLNVPEAMDPAYALYEHAPSAVDEVQIYAGLGFTVCAMLFLPPSARALMLPAQSDSIQAHSQGSWYGAEPKFGNALVAATPPTMVDRAIFDAADAAFALEVRIFGAAKLLRTQLRVLLTLHGWFARAPTPLCRNFVFQGSDKAMRWHNYGYVYNYVLGRMTERVHTILEIGIGTHNLDVPSTMGVTGVPGASLRAWRETFPLATVVGADVDPRILFQEPGIETYWVDQTRADAVAQMFENIGPRRFDLIVDDGLHTFEGNRTLLEGAYAHLAADGVYIIEDVPNGDVPAWEAYLAAAGCDAAMVHLPHPENANDNRLIFIPGGQTPPGTK